ncbi:hypothetical protein CPAST_c15620 [Clostridium pasteurianum DSM 525 = ATCC 6013]|uniref:DUF3298 domain-containing protein n=1 Tax=Clostridium pasteurianum DSM 525 = ATCC 6013 TaxID=1262449 RepID=A0A0H3J455_CLOPA|nr:DUF3298 and DUF4163 domain-containing protein [Clostridium pasteurianum]AJA47637.1 hypothetical protein CPAST_c15620 [Clostridium pasteurianum DSM 525 = ATCC 6013]AJA51625.1 hypothetical protein CLPA_c15620 [Clostridium pasteurianum DSM 525 = ATCC 6013]ELP58023.1 hypothetical protein F502_16290 [Clostridium pasteurianum DSM 525 = ATCC 6013]KRU12368.1 protein of unknown function DUF4163 [Clostridium pasteurianum DSM 525 = ATCC 6013]UZW15808.1 DUF3298 and DUF4163 domain-containing protein [Cl
MGHKHNKFYHFSNPQKYNSKHHKYRNDTSNTLGVTSQNISTENYKIREYLNIPVLSGNFNAEVLKYINGNIKNDILEFKSQMEAAADENAKAMQSAGKPVIPFQISNNYILTYNKNNLLSISLIYQQYINGRNSYIRTSYNYNLENARSMPLGDLFKPDSNYISVLNNKVKSILQANPQDYYPNTASNFKGIAKDQPYYLDNNNLVLFFGFHEIAPTASGVPLIKIPFSELTDILNPQLLRSI